MMLRRDARTPPRRSWGELLADRYPAGALPTISRPALLERLRVRGIPLRERRLRDWERRGILPRPVLAASTAGGRALYPVWYDTIIALVWRERQRARPLADLGAFAEHAVELYALGWPLAGSDLEGPPRPLSDALWHYAHSLIAPVTRIDLTLRGPDEARVQAWILVPGLRIYLLSPDRTFIADEDVIAS